MNVRRNQSRNPVRGSGYEELDRVFAVAQFLVFVKSLWPRPPWVNERAQVQMSAEVHEMQAGRRSKGKVAVLRQRVGGRDQASQQNCQVQSHQQNHRG